jgi:hypothetical protein
MECKMKVNLVKDDKGKVVATFENPATHHGPSVRPKLKPGQSVHEVEADASYKADVDAFYKHHSKRHG